MSKCKSHNTLMSSSGGVRAGGGVISQVQSELPRHYPSIMDDVTTMNSCPKRAPNTNTVQGSELPCYPNPVANMQTAAHRGINPTAIYPEPSENPYYTDSKIIKKTRVDGTLRIDGNDGILFEFKILESSSDPDQFMSVTPKTKKLYVNPIDVIRVDNVSVNNGIISGKSILEYMKTAMFEPSYSVPGSVLIELLQKPGDKGLANQYSKAVRDEIIDVVAQDPSVNKDEVAKVASDTAINRLARTVASFGVNNLKFGEREYATDNLFGYAYSDNNLGPHDQFNDSRKRNSPLVNAMYRQNTSSMFNKSLMLGAQGITQNQQFARNFDENELLVHYTHGAQPLTARDFYAMEHVADGNCEFDVKSSVMAQNYKAGNMNTDNTDILYQGKLAADGGGFQGGFANDFA